MVKIKAQFKLIFYTFFLLTLGFSQNDQIETDDHSPSEERSVQGAFGAVTIDGASVTTTAATQSIAASTSLNLTSPSIIFDSATANKPSFIVKNTAFIVLIIAIYMAVLSRKNRSSARSANSISTKCIFK